MQRLSKQLIKSAIPDKREMLVLAFNKKHFMTGK
jgi:hypothetical protein